MNEVFTAYESEVRTYCRSFPAVFVQGAGHLLTDETGRTYVDFLAGAGALNYGHNDPAIKAAVVDYLRRDGVVHSLDLHTDAKAAFIEDFVHLVLEPRGLRYKLQFAGPTGTNAVEAALKLARKVTGRWNVIGFTNGYHGVSLGSLAATTNPRLRRAAGIHLSGVTAMPFDGYLGEASTLEHIERMLAPGGGVEPPAAFLVETVQGEGGLNVASREWLQGLRRIASDHGALLIVDDIQAGCGRTGTFFSFERMGFSPDLVCLSKSISGLGLPMALLLLDPRLDVWDPGEHNGTFRGHNLAFVAGSAALRTYWVGSGLEPAVERKSGIVRQALEEIATRYPGQVTGPKGRGLMVGLETRRPELASQVSRAAFELGLIVETCGVQNQVLKLLPPLTIQEDGLRKGLDLFAQAFEAALGAGAGLAESGAASG